MHDLIKILLLIACEDFQGRHTERERFIKGKFNSFSTSTNSDLNAKILCIHLSALQNLSILVAVLY